MNPRANERQVELAIIVAEAKTSLEGITDLKERLLAAMRASKDHWMVLDEEVQMRGAIAAVLIVLEEEGNNEDRERITKEMRVLQALGAGASGVPVDFSAIDLPENPIGLVGLWHTVQKENHEPTS